MKQIKNQFIGVGILTAFLIFSVFIADAAHFSGDKIQKDPESWFNTAYRCKAEVLVPVTSKTKGETVMELQNCLRFLNESYVPMDGTWDRETRKSVKWFYKHFLGKKSNGKKFDQAAVGRMRELAALAEPFFPAEPETPAGEEIQEETTSEDLDTETQNAKYMVEGNFNSIGEWRETIQNCPAEIRKSIAFFYEGFIELTPQEQTQYEAELAAYDEEFQNAASEFDTFAKQSQEAYDARNYKEAETLANRMIKVLGQAGKRCDAYKNAPSKVYKQKELALQKEQRAQEEQYEAEEAAKEKKTRDAIAQTKRYFEFTIPTNFSGNVDPVYDPDYYDSAELVRNGIFTGLSMSNSSRQVSIQLFVTDAKGAGSLEELYSVGKSGKEAYGTITKTEKVTINGIRWHHAISAENGKVSNDIYSFLKNGKIYRIEIGIYDQDDATYTQVLKDFKKFVQGVKIK